ncbi:Tm-1-like ATP-binding domain-containing protein [Aerococcus sp. UMB7834]|uniref:Tm-1-like ATP-binding domain-containing protein n=1 Tax=Aerococcus sp. UMB7834 TaxID=3046342 RepID=UPI00254B865B|nr:Tm-1-like ATP-binding domain-containing protein [Aerococcus sp. UMB7834]MDK6804294.1 Tm-1-like ATP-binding domain-containing protein [Aerococcus sp. UMB7834]
MDKTVAIVGTFDTKAREFSFVKEEFEVLGLKTYLIHIGVFESELEVEVNNKEIARAVNEDIEKIVKDKNRAKATKVLSQGLEKILPKLYQEGKFDGVIALGGSGGSSIATAGMRQLPIGVPKIMVSTMASGNVSQYIGTSDIIMFPSIVDVEGLNDISRHIFSNAIHAMVGMLSYDYKAKEDNKPLIAASMFGLTTPAIKYAEKELEARGYETIVFHATGSGGRTMERLISENYFDGVLDLTTTEWCDEVVGGVLNAGPHRLEAAVSKKVPQVVSLGALDMVNFGPKETVPKEFSNRLFYEHNPTVTLMRVTKEEAKNIAGIIAQKLKNASKETTILFPKKGFSGLDEVGKEFYNPEVDQLVMDTIKEELSGTDVTIIEKDLHINDEAFAKSAVDELIKNVEKEGK